MSRDFWKSGSQKLVTTVSSRAKGMEKKASKYDCEKSGREYGKQGTKKRKEKCAAAAKAEEDKVSVKKVETYQNA